MSPHRVCLLVLLWVVLGGPSHAAAAHDTQDSLLIAAPGGGTEDCTWDPACSTAGVGVVLRESSRVTAGKQKLVEYELVGTGLPAGRLFTAWLFPFGERPVPLFTGVTGDSAGGITCADTSVRATAGALPTKQWCLSRFPLFLPIETFAPSEPVKMALISNDDSVRAYATAFPVPLQAEGGGCRLWLELLTTSRDAFRLSGVGFEGGADARFVSTSGKEVIEATRTIPADGSFWTLVSPAVKGKRGGRSSFAVSTPGCTVTLQYKWGRDLK
jgi:hypothetical protein